MLFRLRLRPPRHPRPLPGVRCNSCQGGCMKRLRRILLNALTVLSLLLCVTAIALCISGGGHWAFLPHLIHDAHGGIWGATNFPSHADLGGIGFFGGSFSHSDSWPEGGLPPPR